MASLLYIPRALERAIVSLGKQGFVIGASLLVLVSLLLVPLPRPILDVFIVVNLVASLVLLLITVFTTESKQLSTFPTIVLLTTIYRLALNISSTRLILLHGDQGMDAAGKVIEAFGSFVVQGDFIVGAILFAIIAIVNFVVIAKGSSRVAEVAARFALDAMPGKQLAIDSDYRAGIITKEEALARRASLTEESQFFGAMDGAMRFVQGDAIAGFIIVFINAVGGVGIGMSRGLEFGSAVNLFGVLAIGDGLVNVIPSLLISVCAGVVVTRVSRGASAGDLDVTQAIVQQLTANPRAILTGAVLLLVLSLIPGLPFWPFFVVGALLLIWVNYSQGFQASPSAVGPAKPDSLRGLFMPTHIARLESSATSAIVRLDEHRRAIEPHEVRGPRPLVIEIDQSVLVPFFERDNALALTEFTDYAAKHRENFFMDRGLVLPPIELVSALADPCTFRIVVREQLHRTGQLNPRHVFVQASPQSLSTLGVDIISQVRHPITSVAGAWVDAEEPGLVALERLGMKIVKPSEYLVLEVMGVVSQAIEEIVGFEEVKQLLTTVREQHGSLYEEVFGTGMMSVIEFHELIKRLAREKVSVRDLKFILDNILEFRVFHPDSTDKSDWLALLHSFVRKKLARAIVNSAVSPGGKLRTYLLADNVEEEFRAALDSWDRSRAMPPLPPDLEAKLRRSATTLFTPVLDRGMVPVVLLCSSDVRPAVEEFFCHESAGREWYRTLAFEELGGNVVVESVGMLTCL